MFLPINSEKTEIFLQIKTIEKMRTKLANQTAHIKEFNHVRILFKFIENHLAELETAEEASPAETAAKMALYLSANTRIKNHIGKKLQQVRQLMNDHRYQLYATYALESLARIVQSLSSIEWKLLEAVRDLRQCDLHQKSEILIHE